MPQTLRYVENSAIEEFQSRAPQEEVLDPDLPIVDAHHHLWDIRNSRVPYLDSFEQKVYFCEEFMEDINRSGHSVAKTVYVECGAFYRSSGPTEMRCLGEVEFANGVAAMGRSAYYGDSELCAGIVGTADMRLGEKVEEVVQALLRASPNFCGVRTPLPKKPGDNLVEAFRVLAKYDLAYDYWSPDPTRLPQLCEWARANPDVTFVVDHLGGKIDATFSGGELDTWRAGIESLAGCPNVVLKLGGTQMRIGDWMPSFHMHLANEPPTSEALCELLFPHYQIAIEAFGAHRCMFESNFPVDREGVSYRVLWNFFKRIAAKTGASESEKMALFGGTASKVYKL